MPLTKEHKAKTRARIVSEAAKLFRRRGYAGTGIDEIMSAAGLTRGGFYNHFPSKKSLFAEVMAGRHGFNAKMKARGSVDAAGLTAEALAIVDDYLAPENRTEVGHGCTMASLSVDTARAGAAAKHAYAAKFRELAAEFARGLKGADHDDPRALRAIALSVGGLVIARAMGNDPLAEDLLAACRTGVHRELTKLS